MKILLTGNSFASDWSVWQNIPYLGWPNMLSEKYNVNNIAENGIGNYKIWKQLQNQDLKKYDCVLVCLASPYVIYCNKHPIHRSGMYANCDLIFNDINRKAFFNKKLNSAKELFKSFFDEQYMLDINNVMLNEINSLLSDINYFSLSHSKKSSLQKNHICIQNIWLSNKGNINHLSQKGNQLVFELICRYIDELS